MNKRTKIVCTIGPASHKASTLTSMIRAGMDVARLNFSHGSYADHQAMYRTIRSVAKKLNRPIGIMGDLQGPKIRLGNLPKEPLILSTGSEVLFTTATKGYKNGVIPLTYEQLHKQVKSGERLLIDDGLIEVVVVEVKGKTIRGHVESGGPISSHKGMNFPDSNLRISPITKKDREDVAFMVALGVDWIVFSFVSSPDHVRMLRRLIKQAMKPDQVLPRILAKIEKAEGINRFDEILDVCDGIMIGRGDLAVEIPAEDVPVYQKELTDKCRRAGKPVIIATQMLESMKTSPRPTRAEVSDVANAVFDHTDAVMLSAESATGNYPVETVTMMSAIIEKSELSPYDNVFETATTTQDQYIALSESIKLGSLRGEIDALLVSIQLAPWSETLFRAHPEIPFFLACPNTQVAQQVVLRWGAIPFVLADVNEQTFVHRAIAALKKNRQIKKGMHIAVVMGGSHGQGYDLVEVT